MDSTTYQYAVGQLLSLTGPIWILIILISALIGLGIFFVFRFIFSSTINTQKDLIDAKSEIAKHYQERTEQLSNALEMAKKTLHQPMLIVTNGNISNKNNDKHPAYDTPSVTDKAKETRALLQEVSNLEVQKHKLLHQNVFMASVTSSMRLTYTYKLLRILFLYKTILWMIFTNSETADNAKKVMDQISVVDNLANEISDKVKLFEKIVTTAAHDCDFVNSKQFKPIHDENLDDLEVRIDNVGDFISKQKGFKSVNEATLVKKN